MFDPTVETGIESLFKWPRSINCQAPYVVKKKKKKKKKNHNNDKHILLYNQELLKMTILSVGNDRIVKHVA